MILVSQSATGGSKSMVYGAISGLGKVLLSTLQGKIDSKAFLQDEALPDSESFIRRISYSCKTMHQAIRDILRKLSRQKMSKLWNGHPNQNLNPIEQVWLWMAKDISTKVFKNKTEVLCV